MSNIKQKNAELLDLILQDLKSLKTDIKDMKHDISKIKLDLFTKKLMEEVKTKVEADHQAEKTEVEPHIVSQGWFW
tara:strand:- start:378 stop:605 length:228 start_codon:yes stop_codon:yes gene_type:complete